MTLAEEIKIKVELLEDELDYVQSVKEKALEEVEKLREENGQLRTIISKLQTILEVIAWIDFDTVDTVDTVTVWSIPENNKCCNHCNNKRYGAEVVNL